MKPSSIFLLSFILFFFSLVPLSLTAQDLRPAGTVRGISGITDASPASRARVLRDYGKLPLSFEANKGQTDPGVRFMSRGNGYTLFLTPTETVLALSRTSPSQRDSGNPGTGKTARETAVVEMKLLGSDPGTDITGLEELRGRSNYFIGNDPTKWHTGIPTYEKVSYKNIYPGIDLVYYGNERQLEYDFVVAPGANPNAIKLKIDGARKMRLDKNGDLLIRAGGGDLRLSAPNVYQEESGGRHAVAGRWLQLSGHELQFAVGHYDRNKSLVIDPAVLVYSTYLGGSAKDVAAAVAVDSAGDAYIAGSTGSTHFPVSSNAYQPDCNGCTGSGTNNAFVTELDPTGTTLIYSTYLGGNNGDGANGIAVDSSGDAYVVGTTFSGGAGANGIPFPTTAGAYQTACAGGCNDGDAFVTELNPTGSALVFSTFLGGSAEEEGLAIAVDSQGGVYVTGLTTSTDFPTQVPYQPNCSSSCSGARTGDADVFVTKINPGGATVPAGSTLAYSTYLGGTGNQAGNGIAVDSSGSAYVAGFTNASDFPTVTPYQSTCGGCAKATPIESAFVTKFNASGSAPVYSTFLGGTNYPSGAVGDSASSIAVDSTGAAYVAGSAMSTDFPTVLAFQAACANACSGGDAFVTKFNAAGSALAYSTYLGGSEADQANGIAVDAAGNAFVTGQTSSTDFPTANPNYDFQSACASCANSGTDAFVSEFVASGNLILIFSSYLGGSTTQAGYGIAVGALEQAVVVGKTESTNFPVAPVTGAFQPTYGGGDDDAFVSAFPTAATCGVSYTTSGLTINATLNCWGLFLAGDAGDNQFMGFVFAPGEQTGSGSGGGSDCAVPPGTCSFSSSYTYPSSGTYPVSTTVNDATGAAIITTGFTVSIPTLSITIQPASQTINSGQTATLSVVATGAPTLTYQWYQGISGTTTNKIAGATNSSYTTPALTATTSYWVQVGNTGGSVNSNTATITVTPPPPTITTQPASQTINSGQTASLSVVASGTGLTYQWYQGTSGTTTNKIAGATNDSYTTPALTTTTSYWVQVTDAGGSVNSNTATITVTPPSAPTITTQPASQTISSGQTASLSVVASGTGLTYQWYQGTTGTTTNKIAGATNSSYTTPVLTATTSYWVQVTDAGGSVNSNTATITVTPPAAPTITTQPASQTISSGQTASLSVVASGTGLTYQWYQGTTGTTTNKIAGAVNSSYTTPVLTATTSYWVQVTDAGGSVNSNTATITVLTAPTITSLTLPGGTINEAYSRTTLGATGGVPPYKWSIASGSLPPPPGMSLSSVGVISGTPTAAGTFDFTVQVTDADAATATQALSIAVTSPAGAPTCQPPTLQNNSSSNPLSVTATSNCTDSTGTIASTTFDWGDGTPSGSTASHTYASAGSYSVTVTATDTNNLSDSASGSVTVTAPLATPVVQGQPAQLSGTATAPLGVPSVQVTYTCSSVDGPSGVQTLSFYNITSCNVSPSSVTLTSTPQSIGVTVQTTGTTTASVRPGLRRGGAAPLYAAFLALPGIGLVGIGWSSKRRRKVGRYAGLALLCVMLWILLGCGSSSSMTPPPSNPTPTGSYSVNATGTSSGGTTSSTITVGFTVTVGG